MHFFPDIIDEPFINALRNSALALFKPLGSVPLSDETKGYYQDDPEKIKAMLRDMSFPDAGEGLFRCGYDFEFSLYEKGAYPRTYKACFLCNRLYIKDRGFHISESVIQALLKTYCIPFTLEKVTYENISSGKAALDIGMQNGILLPDARCLPPWYSFEGKFRFLVKEPASIDAKPDPQKVLDKTRQQINQAFPGEPFFLEQSTVTPWGGIVEHWFYLQCNESLYQKMDWEEKEGAWNPYTYFSAELFKI